MKEKIEPQSIEESTKKKIKEFVNKIIERKDFEKI